MGLFGPKFTVDDCITGIKRYQSPLRKPGDAMDILEAYIEQLSGNSFGNIAHARAHTKFNRNARPVTEDDVTGWKDFGYQVKNKDDKEKVINFEDVENIAVAHGKNTLKEYFDHYRRLLTEVRKGVNLDAPVLDDEHARVSKLVREHYRDRGGKFESFFRNAMDASRATIDCMAPEDGISVVQGAESPETLPSSRRQVKPRRSYTSAETNSISDGWCRQ